jgi:predicted O-methyltransferase YrrM
MSQPTVWTAVDSYFNGLLLGDDPILAEVLRASDAGGLPQIAVAPNQGKLLNLLARSIGARHILEIGTLGGYSTVWLGRALPTDGRLITLEYNPHHAEVARANLAHAGLSDKVEVIVGAALDTLPTLEQHAPFDLIFIDADKPNNPAYFAWAVKLSRPGTMIIMDNVVRDGKVIDAESDDPAVQGVRQFVADVAAHKRVTATALQTVGDKGYDGLMLMLVED